MSILVESPAGVRPRPTRPEVVPDEAPTVLVGPSGGWRSLGLAELWRSRELLFFLAWRDVRVRYKQTLLGAGWAVLQPLMMMAVFTVFFGRLAGVSSGKLPYPLFAYAGLLPWTFFATAIAGAGNSVVGSERLITKVYFPRLAIPFASVGAAVVDFAIASGLLLALMAYYRAAPGPAFWLAPLVAGLIVLAALGVGTLLAALNVAYRDFRYVIPFLVQVWMFATPTVYMQAKGSARPAGMVGFLLAANPMTGLIGAFRSAVLGGPIDRAGLSASAVVAAGLFLAGCLYFRKVEGDFADVI